jgi:hypothetical protein
VIKRIRFAKKRPGLSPEAFVGAWERATVAGARAAEEVGPRRIACCRSLPDLIAEPIYDGIGLEWFEDLTQLRRYEDWLAGTAAEELHGLLAEVLDLGASPVLLAAEHVLRGETWLEDRWREGGVKLKHMAIARRARGLTQAEFSERWIGRSGSVGPAPGRAALVIPDEARGLAYVQNHALEREGGDWVWDALNEVYFDDAAMLEVRIAWFAEQLSSEADLVRESHFIATEERVLLDGR